MASGPFDGRDYSREKEKWCGPHKVYTRKLQLKEFDDANNRNINTGSKVNAARRHYSQTPTEDGSSQQPQIPSHFGSDDSSYLHRSPRLDPTIKVDDFLTGSKGDIREARRRLVRELEKVRNLAKRLESKENRLRENSGADLVVPQQFQELNVSMLLDNSNGISDYAERDKNGAKGNQGYRSSSFPPQEGNKRLKSKNQDLDDMSCVFKSCGNLLLKLMKHKHGWVFNNPVDAKGLGLHDYFTIITQPMDLGTVKTKLSKNWYKSPMEFAEDVRLTFRNAMRYNPKGQDVHVMAEMLSELFEEKWASIETQYTQTLHERHGNVPDPHLSQQQHSCVTPGLDKLDSLPMPAEPSLKSPVLKKPKTKYPHKRDMTYIEKQMLSSNLQCLPSEKLDSIVQIIKKRNSTLSQHDDEIEVDIDSVDPETLWELARFVSDHNKALRKKADLSIQPREDNSIPGKADETTKENRTGKSNGSSFVDKEKQSGDGNHTSSSSSSSSGGSGKSSASDSDSNGSSTSGSLHMDMLKTPHRP